MNPRFLRALPLIALLALLSAAFLLALDAERAQGMISTRGVQLLIGLVFVAVLVLLFAIGLQLLALLRRHRANAAGARLEARLSGLFALLSLPPALLVAAFALRFIDSSIDSWFRADVESAQSAALRVGQLSLTRETQAIDGEAKTLSESLLLLDIDEMQAHLDELVERDDAREMHISIYDLDGNLEALAFNTGGLGLVAAPAQNEMRRLSETGRQFEASRRGNIRVARALERFEDGLGGSHILQALYPLDTELANALATLEGNAVDYAQLRFQRNALKTGFSLILGLTALVATFAAVWFALAAARRVVQPIVRLTEATREIAAGRQSQVPVQGNDEIAFLSESFNRMSSDLASAQHKEAQSRQLIEQERALLEAVLERLSAGVLAIQDERILIANAAAQSLLELDQHALRGHRLDEQALLDSAAARFYQRVLARDRDRTFEWREEVEIDTEPKRTLLVRALRLSGHDGERLVLVFDDAQLLAQASREAAWAEVARRLAHEIKNPLTPIQLAAERLRHRLQGRLSEPDRELLERATQTIVQQVEALKRMVNAFGDYAKPSRLKRERFAPVAVLDQVARLYEASAQCAITREFADAETEVAGDRDRLRQVFVNLLTNAVEAGAELAPLRIHLSSRRETGALLIEVRDFGPGLPADFQNYAFEPYRSTKPKGSGLGLSLVKKVMEEHGGSVLAENAEDGGARFLLRFVLDE